MVEPIIEFFKFFTLPLKDVDPFDAMAHFIALMLILILLSIAGCAIYAAFYIAFGKSKPLPEGFIRTHDYMDEDTLHDINKTHISAVKQHDDYTLIEFSNNLEPIKIKEKLEELL